MTSNWNLKQKQNEATSVKTTSGDETFIKFQAADSLFPPCSAQLLLYINMNCSVYVFITILQTLQIFQICKVKIPSKTWWYEVLHVLSFFLFQRDCSSCSNLKPQIVFLDISVGEQINKWDTSLWLVADLLCSDWPALNDDAKEYRPVRVGGSCLHQSQVCKWFAKLS